MTAPLSARPAANSSLSTSSFLVLGLSQIAVAIVNRVIPASDRVRHVDHIDRMWDTLQESIPDMIIVAIGPENDDLDWLANLCSSFPEVCVLVVADRPPLNVVVSAMKSGVGDVLDTPTPDELLAGVRAALRPDETAGLPVTTTDPCVTNPQLLERLGNDDESAWWEFYQIYARMVVGWAREMGCQGGNEEDIMQDVTLKLREKIGAFEYDRNRGSFRGYLKTAVRRKVIDIARRRQRIRPFDRLPDSDSSRRDVAPEERYADQSRPELPTGDRVFLRTLLYEALKRARLGVNERTAMLFERYRLQKQPAAAIAAEFGIKIQTVYEASRRFREEHLAPAFTELASGFDDMSDTGTRDRMLACAIETCLSGKSQYEMTLTRASSREFGEQLRRVLTVLEHNSPPTQLGTYLLSVPPMGNGQWHPLSPSENNVIGRLEGLTLSLSSHTISGRHAAVVCKNGQWWVQDKQSKNGVLINNEPVSTHALINSGDLIRIGDNELLFYQVGADQQLVG